MNTKFFRVLVSGAAAIAVGLGIGIMLSGCNDSDVSELAGFVTNPYCPEGNNMDEYVHWKTRQVQNEDRKVSAKWPSALVDLYGCTPHNTMCVADGTIMDYYNTDVTPSDGKHLSYTTYTRLPSQFPANTVVTLYKDGEPIAGFVMQDPTRDEYFRLPPGQIPVSAPGE